MDGRTIFFAFIRKDDPRLKALFDDIEKLRQEFESIERPNLEKETPSPKAESTTSGNLQRGSSQPLKEDIGAHKSEMNEHAKLLGAKAEQVLDHEAELANLESEFGQVGRDYSAEEIGDWEFDELERDLRSGDSASIK